MSNFEEQYGFKEEEWEACLKVLKSLKSRPFENPDNEQFGALISKIYKQARKSNRKSSYSHKKGKDILTILSTQISSNAIENETVFTTDESLDKDLYTKLEIPRNCYCCNQSFSYLHTYYNRLCPSCAKLNYDNRNKTVNLSGRKVILTGGRVKIGYATALKFLRANAELLVTTRFPASALMQFKNEKDYDDWKQNLTVYGLDLRDLKSIEQFVNYYKTHVDALDILVNNAAQTIKYNSDYYQPLITAEAQLLRKNKGNEKLIANNSAVIGDLQKLKKVDEVVLIEFNRFGQPIDHRKKTSWNSTLEEIDLAELLEVNLINQIAPYYLIKELTPLMKKSAFENKFIINVTSSEGQFSYNNKSVYHPHTNMTKASLNMLTRTSAKEYLKYNIFMNAVDVGWVSTGAREELRKKQFEKGYIPPLDPVDGAARVLMPIINGIKNDNRTAGKLMKNYEAVDW